MPRGYNMSSGEHTDALVTNHRTTKLREVCTRGKKDERECLFLIRTIYVNASRLIRSELSNTEIAGEGEKRIKAAFRQFFLQTKSNE